MFQKVKGFQDIYGDDCAYWEKAENGLKKQFELFGVKEIRLPVMEKTDVFNHGIGQTTDIVEKEMFTMESSGESVSLRPEGTAGVVRAYIENKLYDPPGLKKFYYLGPMFRRERPQKGRYRQFTQGGVEFLGSASPMTDADVINLFVSYYRAVGITEKMAHLEINSVGCPNCRPQYQRMLVDYFTSNKESLCTDCISRLERNPLRILDCKNEKCRVIIKDAPLMLDNLCPECEGHFQDVKRYLGLLGVEFKINPLMVRGLDYYVRTAFEMVTDRLGAASAMGGGGRYDGLIDTLGGPQTPGVGFAIGIDRVIALMKEAETLKEASPLVYIVTFGSESRDKGVRLLKQLRENDISAEIDYDQQNIKKQMKKADRSGAKYAIILGDDELSRGAVTLRDLQSAAQGDSAQREVPVDSLIQELKI